MHACFLRGQERRFRRVQFRHDEVFEVYECLVVLIYETLHIRLEVFVTENCAVLLVALELFDLYLQSLVNIHFIVGCMHIGLVDAGSLSCIAVSERMVVD